VTLVLREGSALDSSVIGNLQSGSTIFVMETMMLEGVVRACVMTYSAYSLDAPKANPLGWVTVVKDGEILIDYVPYESAQPVGAGIRGFGYFSSLSCGLVPSPRVPIVVSPRISMPAKLVDYGSPRKEQDAPWASCRRGAPPSRMRRHFESTNARDDVESPKDQRGTGDNEE